MSIRLAGQIIMLRSKVTKAPMQLSNTLKPFSNSYPREWWTWSACSLRLLIKDQKKLYREHHKQAKSCHLKKVEYMNRAGPCAGIIFPRKDRMYMLLRKSPEFLKLSNFAVVFTLIGCDVCGRHSKCHSEFPPWQVSECPCQSSLVPRQSYRHSDHQHVRKHALACGTPLSAHIPIASDRGYWST